MKKEKVVHFAKMIGVIAVFVICMHFYFMNKVYKASVTNIHYPARTNLEKVKEEAEQNFKSYHYRNAIKKIHPYRKMPKKVNKIKVTARHGEDVEGFKSGIVVDAIVWYSAKPEKITEIITE